MRGQRVMVDADLAAPYGVPTKRLNEQVRRNANRSPQDFHFQLSLEESAALRSQIATSNEGRGGRRYLPYAFTEHGAIMVANVLNSPRAVEMSVHVVRAFVRLREMIASHRALVKRLDELEARHDEQFKVVFDAPSADGPTRAEAEAEDRFRVGALRHGRRALRPGHEYFSVDANRPSRIHRMTRANRDSQRPWGRAAILDSWRACAVIMAIAASFAANALADDPPADYPRQVLADHPTGYWRFEESADASANIARDASARGSHPGTYRGPVQSTEGVPGIGGRAARFDAARQTLIEVPDGPDLASDAVSVELWLRTTQAFDALFWPGSATLVSKATPGAGSSDWTVHGAASQAGR